MKRTKNIFKTLVIALGMLFGVALALGITAAAYNTSRRANGTMYMTSGIVIDYTGFGKTSPNDTGIWQNEQESTFRLFSNASVLPGDSITLNPSGIKKGTGSVDFYARIKLGYKFYTSATVNNEVVYTDVTSTVGDAYSAFLSTPEFATAWVDSNNNDGWFYYATGTTLNTVPSADYVSIFKANETIDIALNAEGFNHAGGGYLFTSNSTDYLITKIEAYLTLETLQSTATNTGWGIVPPALVQNGSSQVVQINVNEITLGDANGAFKLGTGAGAVDTTNLDSTLKIVVVGDSQINANAFENSSLSAVYVGDENYISALSATIYDSPKPTFKIGANAFFGCSSLNVYLSSSVNYEIYASSLSGVANVYYDGELTFSNSIKNPSSTGLIAGTTVSVVAPSILTGGSGAGAVNTSSNNGFGAAYTYNDEAGNVWHFNLGRLSADSQTWSQDNTNGTQAHIIKCINNYIQQEITFPSIVSSQELTGTIPVVNISPKKLYYNGSTADLFAHNNVITSVIIPDTVEIIGDGAFYGGPNPFSALSTITLSTNLKKVGNLAFYSCGSLTSFIGGSEKYQVSTDGLSLIEINGSTRKLIAVARYGLSSEYSVPELVTSIIGGIFNNCSNLVSITLPNTLVDIGEGAFTRCNALQSFFGGSARYQVSADGRCLIEVDGDSKTLVAFAGASVGEYTNMPNIVTRIGDQVFLGCTGLTSIEIPNSVISIGNNAFQDASMLTSVAIPNSVTSIGNNAFTGCFRLISITIPNSVISLGEYIFNGGCSNLETVIIDAQITSVPVGCFSGCGKLSSITLPASVTNIAANAFENCNLLTNIKWKASYNLGGEFDNTSVSFVKATSGLVLGDINLPGQEEITAASITAPVGLQFICWTDGANDYTNTAPIAKVREGLTAVWGDPNSTSTITYNFTSYMGSTSENSVVYTNGRTITLNFNVPFVLNRKLIGWDTNSSATVPTYTINGTKTISISNDITLYAIWEPCTHYSVTISGLPTTTDNTQPSYFTSISQLSAFDGWQIVNGCWVYYAELNTVVTLPTVDGWICVTQEYWQDYLMVMGYSLYSNAWEPMASNDITLTENVTYYPVFGYGA